MNCGESNHFVPKFALKRFRFSGVGPLYEYHSRSGTCTKRSFDEMGQVKGLVPSHIEHGVLENIDNIASLILCNKFYDVTKDTRSILLTRDERSRLAEWFAYFIFRIPLQRWICEKLIEKDMQDPFAAVGDYRATIRASLEKARALDPEGYEKAIKSYGDHEAAVEKISAATAVKIASGELFKNSGEKVFHNMHESGKHNVIAAKLFSRRWRVERTKKSFVISDNPLCRWSLNSRMPHSGIDLPSVEISLPISRTLSVVIGGSFMHRLDVIEANKERTRELNWRQEKWPSPRMVGARCFLS